MHSLVMSQCEWLLKYLDQNRKCLNRFNFLYLFREKINAHILFISNVQRENIKNIKNVKCINHFLLLTFVTDSGF